MSCSIRLYKVDASVLRETSRVYSSICCSLQPSGQSERGTGPSPGGRPHHLSVGWLALKARSSGSSCSSGERRTRWLLFNHLNCFTHYQIQCVDCNHKYLFHGLCSYEMTCIHDTNHWVLFLISLLMFLWNDLYPWYLLSSSVPYFTFKWPIFSDLMIVHKEKVSHARQSYHF